MSLINYNHNIYRLLKVKSQLHKAHYNPPPLISFSFREPALPDTSLIHGRALVSCWEEGLEGADEDAVRVVVLAVEQQLRRLVQGLLMQRNGYHMRDGREGQTTGDETRKHFKLVGKNGRG